jgi:NADP-dependent 3-hydroxy acid dehydrogenase YdfG
MENKTILITGASSGIGKATAIYFAKKSWKVGATMRNIEEIEDFKKFPNIKYFELDVTDKNSIDVCLKSFIKEFQTIDVIFNNAGYALAGAFEATTDEEIRRQFNTNLFGTMDVTRAILPYFRKQNSGLILNTTSSGGILTFPLYSVYNSSKWALEGFMEALQYEVRQYNITIKNIEPGTVNSEFVNNIKFHSNEDYDTYAQKVQHNTLKSYKAAAPPESVAEIVYKASTDNKDKLRYPATKQAKQAFFFRWLLPLKMFNKMVAKDVEKEI